MLKIITSLALFLIGMAAQAQVDYDKLATVTKIKVKNGVELVYTKNATPMLKLESQDEKSLQKVVTSIKGNTLTISAKNIEPGTVKVFISTPTIEYLKASSNSKITLESPVKTKSLEVIINSGAQFCGLTRTEKMKLKASYGTIYNGRSETNHFSGTFNNATINLSGTAFFSSIEANETTYVNAKNFISDNSKINVTNYSSIVIYGKKNLRLVTDESATISYYGCPETVEVNNRYVASN